MKIICAGQSDAGLAFSARYADYNFCLGKGVNTPTAFAPVVAKMQAAAAASGRHVTSFVLVMLITGETDAEAQAKWKHYNDGADVAAMAWLSEQAKADTRSGADTNVRQLGAPEGAVNLNFGTLVGSYASVARMLDEIAAVPGIEGVLLTFDEFVSGVTLFGERIQPLMRSREGVAPLAEVA